MCMGGCGHGKEGATKRVNDVEHMFPQHPHFPPSIGVPSLLSPTLCCNPTAFFTSCCPTAYTIQQVTVGLPSIATYWALQCPLSAMLQARGLQH